MSNSDGMWFDSACTQSLGYVCEYRVPVVKRDGGTVDIPPGMPGQGPPPKTACVSEQDSGLPDSYAELQQQIAMAAADVFVGAAASPPPPDARCVDDWNANGLSIDGSAGAGCRLVNVQSPPGGDCIVNADCASLGANFVCRQVKDDPNCSPVNLGQPNEGGTCRGHSRCGQLDCPPIDPIRCGQIEVCNPGSEQDAGVDPGSNLDAEPFNPSGLFEAGVPEAGSSEVYFDPPILGGKNHSWCKLGPQTPDSVKPANQPSKDKGGHSGGGTNLSFDFDPDLIFDVKANPLSFGEAEMNLHAQAKMVATASLNDFLGQSYHAPIIDVVAGVTAERCRVSSDETHFQVLGLDFIDPNDIPKINSDDAILSPALYDASQKCKVAVDKFKMYGDRAKKAFRDAQQLLAQYHDAKSLGKLLTGNVYCYRNWHCRSKRAVLPGGSTCGLHEPPEITINRLITCYSRAEFGRNRQAQRGRGPGQRLGGDAQPPWPRYQGRLPRQVRGAVAHDRQRAICHRPDSDGFAGRRLRQVWHLRAIGASSSRSPLKLDAQAGNPQRIVHAKVGVVPHAGAGLSAFVGAGVDLGPVAATVGIEGAVTLADVRAPIFAGAGLDMAVESNPRPLPVDVLPPISVAADAFQFVGGAKSFKFFVSYDYGAGIDLLNVLSGEINGRLRIKFFFFSRTWRKRIVKFNGWSFHFDLVSGSSSPDVTTKGQTVSGNTGDPRATTQVSEGRTTMGRSESQLPFMKLALLQPSDIGLPDAGPDAAIEQVSVSTDKVRKFFYDNLCCSALGETCSPTGAPSCCAPNVCLAPVGGVPTCIGPPPPVCVPLGSACASSADCCQPDAGSNYCDGETGLCTFYQKPPQ